MPRKYLTILFLALFTLRLSGQATTCTTVGLAPFVGSFVAGGDLDDAVVTFTARNGELLMKPILWDGPMVLRRISGDSFTVPPHPRFAVRFQRDARGCVTVATIGGVEPSGAYHPLRGAATKPVQLLVRGQPVMAARRLFALSKGDVSRGIEWGNRLLSLPSHRSLAADFLTELARLAPRNAAVHALLGDVHIAQHRRTQAIASYRQAIRYDSTNASAIAALERLGVRAPAVGSSWKLPFTLDALFAPAQPGEVNAVRATWARRDLRVGDVRTRLERTVDVGGTQMTLRLVEHTVLGIAHITAILMPIGAKPGSLPILLEAKGVSPTYFPMTLPGGLTAPDIMAADQGRVVYVIPAYRGERFIVGTDTVASAGVPNNAWDGATDDLIAALNLAIRTVPEADTSRVCVFGRSRGGTVALAAGIREKRIDCVVSWAAPVDWFRLMGLDGWSQRELVADGLQHRSDPEGTGGQFIDHFLSDALAGRADVADTRQRMIASAPLYFADHLPKTQAHWGTDDAIVPVINGREFVKRYRASGRRIECLDARFHSFVGHDQDRQLTPQQSHAFLMTSLFGDSTATSHCRVAGH